MILSRKKTEEYRDIKPYWEKRFENYFGKHVDIELSKANGQRTEVWNKVKKTIIFRNGYDKDVPSFVAEYTIREEVGKPEWGAEKDVRYYVLTIEQIHS